MQDIQTLAQQNKLKNIIVDYIRALQEERERLRRIQNPPGIIDSLNSTRMSIFDKENFNNIDNHLDQLDNAITTLNGLLNNPNELNVKNLRSTMNDINQNQPHAMETINAIGRTKRNQIAVTTLGAAVVGLSIAITVLTFGAAAPAMIGLNAAIFTVGVGAIALGAKSIHDRTKALLKTKIKNGIMPTKSEIFLYPKIIKEILLNEKGNKEFTEFQEQLYEQVDEEYYLRKKIEAGTDLTPTEKFFHKRKIRRILQEKINNGEELSGYAQELYNELVPSNPEIKIDTVTEEEIETNDDGSDISLSEEEFENPLYVNQNQHDHFEDEPSEGESSTQPPAQPPAQPHVKPLSTLKESTSTINPVDFDHSDSDYSEL